MVSNNVKSVSKLHGVFVQEWLRKGCNYNRLDQFQIRTTCNDSCSAQSAVSFIEQTTTGNCLVFCLLADFKDRNLVFALLM